ncbi:MAG: hypothetical protein ACK5NC_15320 [Vibrio sp.]
MKAIKSILLMTSLCLTSMAMAAESTGFQLDVQSHLSELATIKVTQDGKPLDNYPVEIQAEMTEIHTTDKNGQIEIVNQFNSGKTYHIRAQDLQGNLVEKEVYLKMDRNN